MHKKRFSVVCNPILSQDLLRSKTLQSRRHSVQEQESEFFKIMRILLKEEDLRTSSDLKILSEFITTVSFFNKLSKKTPHLISQCCKKICYIYKKKDEILFKEDDLIQNFYILLKGKLVLYILKMHNDISEKVYEKKLIPEGDSVIELSTQHYYKGIKCISIENSHILFLEKSIYEKLLFSLKEEKQDRTINFFSINFFKMSIQITRDLMLRYILFFQKKKIPPNHIIYKENDNVEEIFLIKKGEVQLFKNTIDMDNKITCHNISLLTSGQIFGDELIINRPKRLFHAKSSLASKTVLYSLSKNLYLFISDAFPDLKHSFNIISNEKLSFYKKRLNKLSKTNHLKKILKPKIDKIQENQSEIHVKMCMDTKNSIFFRAKREKTYSNINLTGEFNTNDHNQIGSIVKANKKALNLRKKINFFSSEEIMSIYDKERSERIRRKRIANEIGKKMPIFHHKSLPKNNFFKNYSSEDNYDNDKIVQNENSKMSFINWHIKNKNPIRKKSLSFVGNFYYTKDQKNF